MSDDLLGRAAGALRAADGGGPDDDALVTRALLAGKARHLRRVRTRRAWLAGGAALAAAAAVALLLFRPAPPTVALPTPTAPPGVQVPDAPPAAPPSPLIRGDDRLTPSEGARFRLDFDDASRRAVSLTGGAMLFDLAPLPESHVFVVRTPHLEVRVTGTVFAVEVHADDTAVEVYEGSVLVRHGPRSRLLRAGQRIEAVDAADLRAAGEEAARARSARVRTPSAAGTDERRGAPSRSRRARRRASTRPDERPTPAPTPEQVRATIIEGRAEEALTLARAAAPSPAWRYVEADALRALGRTREAASAYDLAALGLEGPARREAALLAAQIHLRDDAPERALASLERGRVTEIASPLRERALVLQAEALARLERNEALVEVAQTYLRLYPSGYRAAWMGRVADGAR